jgi:hypothetical protein
MEDKMIKIKNDELAEQEAIQKKKYELNDMN